MQQPSAVVAAARKSKRRSIVVANNPRPRVPPPIVTRAPRTAASTYSRGPPARSPGYGQVTLRPVSIAETDVQSQLLARIEALEHDRPPSAGWSGSFSALPLAGGGDTLSDLRHALNQLRAKEASIDALSTELAVTQAQLSALVARERALETKIDELERLLDAAEKRAREEDILQLALRNELQELKGNTRVFLRVRPFLTGEAPCSDWLQFPFEYNGERKRVVLKRPMTTSIDDAKRLLVGSDASASHEFSFDRVFDPESTQEDIFHEISQLVRSALDGYHVAIFAYGQASSGKTYTMDGPEVPAENTVGVIPRTIREIFETVQRLNAKGWVYTVRVSALEIYGKELHDLLDPLDKKSSSSTNAFERLAIRDPSEGSSAHDDVTVTNLTVKTVENARDVYPLLARARTRRATAVNKRSSRSHFVFRVQLAGTNARVARSCESTLSLIDLAVSEHSTVGGVNQSLSVLGQVMAVSNKKGEHIPYRRSLLTQLLQKAIGGNGKTLVVVNVSPSDAQLGETLSSLRFANECRGTAAKR